MDNLHTEMEDSSAKHKKQHSIDVYIRLPEAFKNYYSYLHHGMDQSAWRSLHQTLNLLQIFDGHLNGILQIHSFPFGVGGHTSSFWKGLTILHTLQNNNSS